MIFITGHGTTDTAIEAMKLGAYDYLVKPLDADQLQQVVDAGLRNQPADARAGDLEDGERPQDQADLLIGRARRCRRSASRSAASRRRTSTC